MASMTQQEQVTAKLLELEAALKARSPLIPNLLGIIHHNLQQYPELTHVLTEEQIGVISSGLSFQSSIVIATTEKKSGGKATKNMGLGDI